MMMTPEARRLRVLGFGWFGCVLGGSVVRCFVVVCWVWWLAGHGWVVSVVV